MSELTSATTNSSTSTRASFTRFYHSWMDRLRLLVRRQDDDDGGGGSSSPSPDDVVDKIMAHVADYYAAKLDAVQSDVLAVLMAPWTSSLERALHWVGGWRPTTLFHLLYTESSVDFEARIIDIIRGIQTGDLSELSATQLRRISEFQCQTVREENAITKELSEWQDRAAEFLTATRKELEEKIGRLGRIVERADDLRLRTMRLVVGLLTPQQAAQFLTAAVELQFGVRRWGLSQDRIQAAAS